MEAQENDLRTIEITDERSPLAREAVKLIRESVWEVQPTADLLSELEERRRRMPSGGDYHLLVQVDGSESPVAAAAGVYLEAVNAGFVTYLAVRTDQRGNQLGRALRGQLIEAFRADAQRTFGRELAWTVGEVRRENPWLRALVHGGGAIPLALGYFHPWLPRSAEGRYVLYREPVGDLRGDLPSHEVASLLYTIWRRAYRVDYPLQSETFCYMLRQLEDRSVVSAEEGLALLQP